MTIAFGSAGTKVITGTTTIDLPQPSGVVPGDLLVACRNIWMSTGTITAESGWTNQSSAGGGINTAVDDHTTRCSIDTREAVGGEGTVTFDQVPTVTTGGTCGLILQYTKASGTTWALAADGTSDNTHAANFASTASAAVAFAPGDMLVAVVGIDTDAALTITSPTFTATGITFGTVTRRTSGVGSTDGNDGNIEVFDALVTAGTASIGVSVSFTTATSVCGAVRVLRLRETAGTNLPPPELIMATRLAP